MTEHEKLKEICDLIGFESDVFEIILWGLDDMIIKKNWWLICEWNRDVREIIFTPEFMKKLENYCYSNIDKDLDMLKIMIMSNLRDPVQYLYNTLWLWK